MDEQFKVDHGRPIPSNRHNTPFPMEAMNIGDSFDVRHGQMKPTSVGSRVTLAISTKE